MFKQILSRPALSLVVSGSLGRRFLASSTTSLPFEGAFDEFKGNLPGGVIIAVDQRGKRTLIDKTWGHATIGDSENPARPVDRNKSVFRLASNSKIFTGVAMLQCVERGQIGLDDPVAEYLPELKDQSIISRDAATGEFRYSPAENQITVRRMLSHTSGIGYDILNPNLMAWRGSRGEPLSKFGRDAMTFNMPLLYQPGQGWEYGANFDAMGILISRLNGGMAFEDYLQENICRPLGLTSTTFFIRQRRPDLYPHLVDCRTRDAEGRIAPWGFDFSQLAPDFSLDNPVQEQGCNGLNSSGGDFITFLSDLLQERPKLLKPETVELVFRPQLAEGSAALESLLAVREDIFYPSIGNFLRGSKLNHSLGGLMIQDGEAAGSVCWSGMGSMWYANREKGLAAVYLMQLMPVYDLELHRSRKSLMQEMWRLSKS